MKYRQTDSFFQLGYLGPMFHCLAEQHSAVGSTSDSRARGPGSIPGPATYLRFSRLYLQIIYIFCRFKKGSCQLLVKVCARSTG